MVKIRSKSSDGPTKDSYRVVRPLKRIMRWMSPLKHIRRKLGYDNEIISFVMIEMSGVDSKDNKESSKHQKKTKTIDTGVTN